MAILEIIDIKVPGDNDIGEIYLTEIGYRRT